MSDIKLHIGGQQAKEGWSILNIQPGPGVDYVGDCSDLSMFADGSCAEVYASHVLEHLSYQDVLLRTVKDIHRILKPGGRFRVAVPDLEQLCRIFVNPNATVKERYALMRIMFGGQLDPHDYHYVGLWPAFLASLLKEAGFSRFEQVGMFGEFKDGSEVLFKGQLVSLNMEAYK